MDIPFSEEKTVQLSVEDWIQFYSKDFGIIISRSELDLLPEPAFPNWVVVESAELTPNMAYNAMARRFTCQRSFVNLNCYSRLKLFKGVRSYFIHARINPDRDLAGYSAQMLWNSGIETMTLQARCALECLYFDKTAGFHLDVYGFTLCAASCNEGIVPFVNCFNSNRGIYISWIGVSSICGGIRARRVFE